MDNSDNTVPGSETEPVTERATTPSAPEAGTSAEPQASLGGFDGVSPTDVNPTPTPHATVSSLPTNIKTPHKSHKGLLLSLLALLLILGAGAGGYLYGKSKAAPAKSNTQTTATQAQTTELTVPQGATVIAQCAKGRGTQYALPKDIPLGPVYNVYEGKVIGVEFMVGKDDLLVSGKNYLGLPLNNVKYDHVNIGLLSQGHAGFPLPHYHVDIMTVPTSVTDKITCT